jgi:hypothetical protein
MLGSRTMVRLFPPSIVLLVISVAALRVSADTTLNEYVDPKYRFVFQYPQDWTLDTQTHPGKGGEMRAAVRDAQSSARAVVSVGQIGKSFSQADLKEPAQRDTAAQGLIELSVKQIYEQASQGMHATKMLVNAKQVLPSDDGIKFYISTLQVVGDESFVIAGTHLVPYDQRYMISFIMMSPLKLEAAQQSAINQIFNSFRLAPAPAK